MKKYILILSAALCAAITVSCSKTADEGKDTPPTPGKGILNPVSLTFETPITKVAIDGEGKASWEEGDQVRIICFNAEDDVWTSDPITVVGGKISATVEDAEIYYSVYPASAEISLEKVGDVDNLKVTIPKKQEGTFKNACYYAAKTTKAAKTFHFKAISGILKFEADPAYKQMDIRDVENTATRHLFAATETCTFDGDGNVTVTPVANDNSMISITLDGKGTYYAAICGNAVNEAAFRFSKETGDNAKFEPGVFYNNLITYAPAHIKNFGKLTDKIVTDVYVSPDGAGTKDGRSAENAAPGSDLAWNSLGDTTKYTAVKGLLYYQGVWNCFRRDGLTIHFAEGEYTDAFIVKGDNSSFELTLQGENGAILKGGLTVSATRVAIPEEGQRATVTRINDLTFTAATGLTCTKGFCELVGCTFANCTTRAAAIGGNEATDENLKVNFRNCLFSANKVASSGTVVVPQASTGGILGFHNCRFENNVAIKGPASAIYTNTGKTAIFLNKCTFMGNKCTTTSNSFTIGTNDGTTRFGMNCCTVNAGTPNVYTNGASLTLKGQSVIANSTVWTSQQFGGWGLIALGCATSTGKVNGASIINSVIRQNGEDYPVVFMNQNYYQNFKYCLHSGKDLHVYTGTIVDDEQISKDESKRVTYEYTYKVSSFNSPSPGTKVVDGITAYYYTWNYANTIGSTGFTKPTEAQVRAAISATGETSTGAADGVGGLFLAWLDEIDPTAFTKDLIGAGRSEGGICPGSTEQAK